MLHVFQFIKGAGLAMNASLFSIYYCDSQTLGISNLKNFSNNLPLKIMMLWIPSLNSRSKLIIDKEGFYSRHHSHHGTGCFAYLEY